MSILQRRIRQAGRRLFLETVLHFFCGLAIGSLVIAVAAIAVPKIWAIEFLQKPNAAQVWFWSWIGGAIGFSLIGALVCALIRRQSPLHLAIEIDRRFRLRERLSSALAIDEPSQQSPAGMALLNDANKRADALDLAEKFPIRVGRWAYSVLIPALAIAALSLVGNRTVGPQANDEELTADAKQQIIQAAHESKMKIERHRKPAENEDPIAQTEQFLAQQLDDLAKQDLDNKKEVLFRLSDMQSEIDKQRAKLGDVDSLKRELSRLDARDASAKSLADALREGKLDEAQDAVRDLIDKLKAGHLDQESLEKISKDLTAMAKSLEKAKTDFEQKQKDLTHDLEKALADGNADRAEQLQRELENLQESRRQMEQLEKLASGMRKAANQLAQNAAQSKSGGPPDPSNSGDQNQHAAQGQKSADAGTQDAPQGAPSPAESELDSLEAMAEQIADLEAEMGQCNRLDEMAEQIQSLKGQCQGDGQSKKPGDGPGQGQGIGERPLDEDSANVYRSQVRSNVRPGETVKYDTAEGPNAPGVSRESIKQQIQASNPDEVDPQQDQKLTKAEREHLREYYQKLRDDQN